MDAPALVAAWPSVLGAAALGYLLGSIPFGLLIARVSGLGDVRRIGSGNIGATNVLRTGNKVAAALTLLADIGKGTAAVLLADTLLAPAGEPLPRLLAGAGAMAGHVFPVWLWFRGGKGVATALGVALALAWPAGLAACLTWLAVAAGFRYSSLAALAAVTAAPLYMLAAADAPDAALTALIALLVWVRHGGNLRRLAAGTEPRIGSAGGAGPARDA